MNICQTLSDNYSKQTYNMQDYMFMRLLSMKMGLFSSYRSVIYNFLPKKKKKKTRPGERVIFMTFWLGVGDPVEAKFLNGVF